MHLMIKKIISFFDYTVPTNGLIKRQNLKLEFKFLFQNK